LLTHPPAAGDYLRQEAEMDLIVVGSACPQDVTVINGAEKRLRDMPYVVEG
jgi:uncharacterized protein YcgI (DUF1989 family)